MQEAPQEQSGSVWKTPYAKQVMSNAAMSALIGGVLLVLVSRVIALYEPKQEAALLSFAAVTYNWSIQYGGFALLIAAALCFLAVPYALVIDAIITAIIGAAWITSSGLLVMLGYGFMNDILFIAIGAYFIYMARNNLIAHRSVLKIGNDPVMMARSIGSESYGEMQRVDADQAAARAEALRRVVSQKEDGRTTNPSGQQQAQDPARRKGVTPPPMNVDVSKVREEKEPPPDGFLADFGKDDG